MYKSLKYPQDTNRILKVKRITNTCSSSLNKQDIKDGSVLNTFQNLERMKAYLGSKILATHFDVFQRERNAKYIFRTYNRYIGSKLSSVLSLKASLKSSGRVFFVVTVWRVTGPQTHWTLACKSVQVTGFDSFGIWPITI